MGAISEAKAALDLLKEVAAYLKKTGEYDPKLMGMFEDLRVKVLSLCESDAALREKVRELEEKLKLREEVFFDHNIGAYFKGTPENRGDGPFCAKCYAEKDKLVPMISKKVSLGCVSTMSSRRTTSIPSHGWHCPVCKNRI